MNRVDWSPRTILVVDDETSVRELMVRVLRDAGYLTLSAKDGDEALALAAQQGQIDLLVTDVVMRGMSGDALAEKLRAERSTLAVLFTSTFSPARLGEEKFVGAAFLEKPFAPQELAAAVADLLSKHPK